jgi:hypothetical protein
MNESKRYSQVQPSACTSASNRRCEPFDNRVFQLSNQVASGRTLTAVPGGKDSFDGVECQSRSHVLLDVNIEGKGDFDWGWSEFRGAEHKHPRKRSNGFIGIGLAIREASEVLGFQVRFALRATTK